MLFRNPFLAAYVGLLSFIMHVIMTVLVSDKNQDQVVAIAAEGRSARPFSGNIEVSFKSLIHPRINVI